eukprot:7414096-Prorocentrum_lima.AAC.1
MHDEFNISCVSNGTDLDFLVRHLHDLVCRARTVTIAQVHFHVGPRRLGRLFVLVQARELKGDWLFNSHRAT